MLVIAFWHTSYDCEPASCRWGGHDFEKYTATRPDSLPMTGRGHESDLESIVGSCANSVPCVAQVQETNHFTNGTLNGVCVCVCVCLSVVVRVYSSF